MADEIQPCVTLRITRASPDIDLYVVTSDELGGLIVHGRSVEEAIFNVPQTIDEIWNEIKDTETDQRNAYARALGRQKHR